MSDRGPLAWIVAIAVGIAAVLVVTAAIGNRDKSGETVPASEWTQSVCGSVGTWRGQMQTIVDEVRQPPSRGSLGVTEPQSETPQTRRTFVRTGLERAVQATDTLVAGIDNAGQPDTPQGAASAEKISDWASSSQENLEQAQDSLDTEADTLEEAVEQLTTAAGSIGTTLASGVRTLRGVATSDPALAAALRDSSTCQELRKKEEGR